ncbi:hypothetical protein MnTg02_02740 [bacterium MnTg02]|nr:hypothetical protein MnTg02_02740 [bacterium MnTg02]
MGVQVVAHRLTRYKVRAMQSRLPKKIERYQLPEATHSDPGLSTSMATRGRK